jgi:glucosamine-6-phosphate deaminase
VRWTRERILVPLGVPDDRFVSLPGTPGDVADPTDVDAACRAYDRTVRAAGGFDLAILGLGPNGHLGFNEPPSSAEAPTRRVALTDESLASNAVYWGGRDVVPREAVTAGMDLLLAARTILLIVTGARKRDILHRTLHGPVDPRVPASFLQRCPQAIVVADAAAVGAQAAGSSEAEGA